MNSAYKYLISRFKQPLNHYLVPSLVSLIFIAICFLLLWIQLSEDDRSAKSNIQNTAKIIAVQVESSLDQTESIMNNIGSRYLEMDLSNKIELNAFRLQIKEEIEHLPLKNMSLLISTPEGLVKLNTSTDKDHVRDKLNPLLLSLLPYIFNSSSDFLFTDPIKILPNSEWSIFRAKRLSIKNKFYGVVFLQIPIDSINASFLNINLGKKGVISLRDKNLIQIIRLPAGTGPGAGPGFANTSNKLKDFLYSNIDATTATYSAVSPIDNIERIYAFQRFNHLPFAILMGLAKSDLPNSWQFNSIGLSLLTSIFCFVIFVAAKNSIRSNKSILSWFFNSNALQQSKLKTQAESNAKSNFLATMSHEIRTPLNAILGLSQAIKEESIDPKLKIDLQRIINTTQVLSKILNDILDLSKIEEGKLSLEHLEFNLKEVLESTVYLFKQEAKQKNLTLDLKISGLSKYLLVGDPIRISQILINLISNAIKFTHTGGVKVISDLRRKNLKLLTLNLKITDTGIGIPLDSINRIFDKFEQADSSIFRYYGGSGLGLTITKSIIDAMGGSISVHSKEQFGTTFHIVLDFQEAFALPLEVENLVNRATNKHYKILIVDDVQLNREIIIRILSKYGHTFFQAANGKEAVSLAMNTKFDLVLMDLEMPNMSGQQATQIIRSKGINKETKIVALTGYAFPNDLLKIKSYGMDGHISKPINIQDLKDCILKLKV